MGLQRRASQHRTSGVRSEDYAEFAVGDRVDTVDGFLGTVTEVQDGPFPSTEQYVVMLDDDMGGGEYDSSQLTRVAGTTAGAAEAVHVEAMPYEATGTHTASEDYPELAEILVDRPPLPHSEPMRMHAAKTAAAVDWDEVYDAYWCDACGFKGQLPPSTNGLDVCPSCGHTEVAVDIDGNRFQFGLAASLRTEGGLYDGIPQDIPPLPEYAILQQFEQYPQSGPEGVSYFKGVIDSSTHVDCLLYREGGRLLGVLNHYPKAMGPERKGNVLLLVHPDARRQGIGKTLWDEAKKRWNVKPTGQDQTPMGRAFTDKVGARDLSIYPSADEHVLIATAGLWDRVRDTGLSLLDSQMDAEDRVRPGTSADSPRGNWCRFLKRERCYFPKELDAEATKQTGYAVWQPEDRGVCPRVSWDLQKKCPVSEPGPDSNEPNARMDATVSWRDGGQRMPEGWVLGSLEQVQGSFEFTGAWSDVRNKAKRIRQEGGVRIISAPRPNDESLTITAEVKGDNYTYETTLLREPGRRNVASWSCGCAWASYSWGRSGPYRKYEGRMCSHALAVQYEAQAQGMGGRQITEQADTPPWRMDPFHYEKPPRKGDHTRAASLRPVSLDGDLNEAPSAHIARHSSLSREAKVMLFQNLKALVRGGIRTIKFVISDTHSCLVEGFDKPVPTVEVLYPSWHPSLGLSLSHTAHLVDGSDGPHIPGTDEHYPYDEQWADPSRWGRNHFGVWGDDFFVFETDNSHEMSMGDPAGAASYVANLNDEPEPALPVTTAEEDDDLVELAHSTATVVQALNEAAPEMAEVVGQSLTETPPGPGDHRLSWLMDGAGAPPGAGAGGDLDIAGAAKAHLAKVALKSFTPAEQAEIINEGLDVQAANLADLDIAGTHYEGLEAALQQAEAAQDEEDLFS